MKLPSALAHINGPTTKESAMRRDRKPEAMNTGQNELDKVKHPPKAVPFIVLPVDLLQARPASRHLYRYDLESFFSGFCRGSWLYSTLRNTSLGPSLHGSRTTFYLLERQKATSSYIRRHVREHASCLTSLYQSSHRLVTVLFQPRKAPFCVAQFGLQ